MNRSLLRTLPTIIAAVALAIASGQPVAPLLLIVFALATSLVPWRVPMDRATQRLGALVLVVLTIAALRASGVRGVHLGAFGYGVALVPLVVASLRLVLAKADGGPRVDVALGMLSLLAIGGARPGVVYVGYWSAFLAAVVAVSRARTPHRGPLRELSARTHGIGAALLAVAALVALGLVGSVHAVQPYVQKTFRRAFESAYSPRLGLGDTMYLGDLTSWLDSDDVVARVSGSAGRSGAAVDRLRGVVLDEYAAGRWVRAKNDVPRMRDVPREPPAGSLEVRHVGETDVRLLVPLDARALAAPEGALREDSRGLLQSVSRDGSRVVWFTLGERDGSFVAPAAPADLVIPSRLRPSLARLARAWTPSTASSREEALSAVQGHLMREFAYSLAPKAESSLDPVMDFLTVSRSGHCEYFASSLALLGRSLGIPTRMVLGYRVAERHPLFAHYVVRRKNAHAWVEAQMEDGRWVTFDPTPMAELPQNAPHEEATWPALVEAVAVVWERVEAWLAARTVFELGAAATFGLLVFVAQRRWRERQRGEGSGERGLAFTPPAEAFLRLERALERRGWGRATSETIEAWAERIGVPEIRSVLLRYASARYGDERGARLDGELDRTTRRLSELLHPPPIRAR